MNGIGDRFQQKTKYRPDKVETGSTRWAAMFARTKWKYAQRAYCYVYLDAGHIAENLALAAVSLGPGSCPVGALFDDEVNNLLGVDGIEESVVYMSVVGIPA